MISRFLKYVEIQTKITSVFAFLMVLACLFAQGSPINWLRTAVFFGSMFIFDLTATAINNYIDTKNNGQPLTVSRRAGLVIIYVLFAIGAGLGLWLAAMTDVVVLLVGALCFVCGVFYTYGPLPISRMPLGEVISGLFYGMLIPFLLFYINLPQGALLTLNLSWETVGLQLQVWPLLRVFLLGVAPFCATANIMLANNICDVEKDVLVHRHTLAYYLGKKALWLFALLAFAPYGAAVLLVALGMLPWPYLLILLTAIPVTMNIRAFFAKQDKATTFVLSIKNYVLLMSAAVLLIFICHWAGSLR